MQEKTYEFELYRICLERPSQSDLFAKPPERFPNRSEVIRQAILSRPSIELKTVTWHIGNVTLSENDWIYFLIGKTSQKRFAHFDEEALDFTYKHEDESPFTHCIAQPSTGIVGIAKNSSVTQKVKTIATKLQNLLVISETVIESTYEVSVKDIADPFTFIQRLKSAAAIHKFQFYVSPSNPIDLEGRFHKLSKKFVDESEANEGKVSVQGSSLNREVIVETTASVSAAGDDASALIKPPDGGKSVRLNLKGNAVKVKVTETEIVEHTAEHVLEASYKKIQENSNE